MFINVGSLNSPAVTDLPDNSPIWGLLFVNTVL